MADVKERYLSSLRSAKKKAAQVKKRTDISPEERRIFDAFSKHAELDFQSLKKSSRPKRGR